MKEYKNPIPTVDAIIQNSTSILLVKRSKDPFKNQFALPGGFVNEGETIEEAIKREVYEETSLEVHPIDILGVYSDPKRDPRGHMMTVVFIVLIIKGNPNAGDDAKEISWIPIQKINDIEIAFDHKLVIHDYLRWKKEGGTYWTQKLR
ncbi:MAG TPA: NUDIX hydrolase [Nitrososphaeraceae archaeon]|nr:NUDIX hydrolase [Nitrososphaeraceae archaeon]HEU5172100.1 NUDIX hydrolase [Nitrososphaeraceae archaeon]